MPKVTEAHLEARRQQILEAAAACFARQGFHQTTMQDICQEAGLSPGALYRYFPSKDDIIAATCLECQEHSATFIESALIQTEDTLTLLDMLVDYSFSRMDSLESLERMRMHIQLWSEALRNANIRDKFCQAYFEPWVEILAGIIRSAQERGEVNPAITPEAVARVLVSTWNGLVLQKVLSPDVDVEEYVQALTALYRGVFWIGKVDAE